MAGMGWGGASGQGRGYHLEGEKERLVMVYN